MHTVTGRHVLWLFVGLCVAVSAPLAVAADTDGDGMEDQWEKSFGLDPADDDSGEDPDYDNYTNAEEFQLKSDPTDVDSPDTTVFVATSGLDASGRGARKAPYKTITYALANVTASSTKHARIVVGSGAYDEDLTLKAYVTVTGTAEPPTGPGKLRFTYASIIGNHTGANHSGLENLILYPGVTNKGILQVNDVAMLMRNSIFHGPGYDGIHANAGIGIQVVTNRSDGIVLEKCDFSGLSVGIQCSGDFPLIRQCFFEDITNNAIDIYGGRTFTRVNLGIASDPGTGFNSFDLDTIGGSIITTDWIGTLRMENNTWHTTNLSQIASRLNTTINSFDFDPPGDETTYSLLPASIACTLTDGGSGVRVENATVQISPTGYSPLTENEDGVYVVPAIVPGSYTVLVQAPNFETTSQSINVQQGEIKSVLFELEKFQSGDTNRDNRIVLSELLRLIQFYNSSGYFCQDGTEDDFAPGNGSHSCAPHTIDYNPQNWAIGLSELLRAIQFYNSQGYHSCPGDSTEDGFCPGAAV